jgi:uncharacterized protein
VLAVLILLPPSEGKHAPARGHRLDLPSLSFPELEVARAEVLEDLVRLCHDRPDSALEVLGLGPRQAEEVQRDAGLPHAPAARADRIYTGVLYDALGLPHLDPAARRRAARWVLIASGLFGMLRPTDRIPAYRLSGGVRLPGVGPVARHWARHLAQPLEHAAGGGLVVDLRSSAYLPFWRPPRSLSDRVATIRVLHDQHGRRSVVSHFNKATKGRIVRALLEDGATPRNPQDLAGHLAGLGWRTEPQPARAGAPTQLDVVVTAIT